MNIEAIQQLVCSEYANWQQKIRDHEASSSDMLHSFRMTFEPYIYHLLINRYGSKLDDFWKTYLPPKKAEKAFVIVERRCHPNFWLVLRNIAWANPDMSVYIFCSDLNINFIKGLLGDKVNNFNIIESFKGSPPYFKARNEYSKFMTDYRLYEQIEAEWIITVQMDVFIRRKIPESIFMGEYWGYPFGWRPEYAGGGGATIRNVKKMCELCKTHKYIENMAEDVWFCEKMLENNISIPEFNIRKDYIMENVPSTNPYIVHQFWTYIDFFKDILHSDIFRKYWNHILTFEGI